MSNQYFSETYGDTQAEDMAACERTMRVLQKHYPDHPWLIGCEHFAGMVHCRLMYSDQMLTNKGYGFMLKLSTVLGGDGERRIMNAGGECLERFKLLREHATEQSAARAAQNGLDLSNIIGKSKH